MGIGSLRTHERNKNRLEKEELRASRTEKYWREIPSTLKKRASERMDPKYPSLRLHM
jgi:hypothetical protein